MMFFYRKKVGLNEYLRSDSPGTILYKIYHSAWLHFCFVCFGFISNYKRLCLTFRKIIYFQTDIARRKSCFVCAPDFAGEASYFG